MCSSQIVSCSEHASSPLRGIKSVATAAALLSPICMSFKTKVGSKNKECRWLCIESKYTQAASPSTTSLPDLLKVRVSRFRASQHWTSGLLSASLWQHSESEKKAGSSGAVEVWECMSTRKKVAIKFIPRKSTVRT